MKTEMPAGLLELMFFAAVMSWLLDQVDNPLLDGLSKAYDLFLSGVCTHAPR